MEVRKQLTVHKDHLIASFVGTGCCSGGRSPREGSGKQPASLHPWTSIPRKRPGRAKPGLEGKLICSITFTTLLKTSHIGQANKRAVQTTSAFITMESIIHVFLIFACVFLTNFINNREGCCTVIYAHTYSL